jgi:hypothetical protein
MALVDAKLNSPKGQGELNNVACIISRIDKLIIYLI